MPTIVKPNQSIEGEKIEGSCRDPLRYYGSKKCNGARCYKFLADFDVKSNIIEMLEPATQKLKIDALTSITSKLICERAVITSVKNKYSSSLEHVSAEHRGNVWSYPNQTNVMIIRSHQDIQNAIEKRQLQLNLEKQKQIGQK